MRQEDVTRVQRLQERINAALHENIEAVEKSDFSDYLPRGVSQLTNLFAQAAQPGGIEGAEAALDEFERLAESEDLPRLQHALMLFLANHRAVAGLGLRIPSLAERSPSQILPSKRDY
jgi:hypothetical protein